MVLMSDDHLKQFCLMFDGHGPHPVIVRSGWKSPTSLWTVRSGNLAASDQNYEGTACYNIWTDLAVSVPDGGKESNCRLRPGLGGLIVEVLADVPEGGLIVLNKDYSAQLLREFLPVDYPIDLSSPLFFNLQTQKVSSDLILR